MREGERKEEKGDLVTAEEEEEEEDDEEDVADVEKEDGEVGNWKEEKDSERGVEIGSEFSDE